MCIWLDVKEMNEDCAYCMLVWISVVEREGMDLSELRKTVEEMEVVDGHSHNIVAFYSNSISSGFVQAFTVGASADPDAAAFAQTTLSFKVTSSMLLQSLFAL